MELKKMMTERFIIDCNGIIDTWNSKGRCEDRLTWEELCKTLNELDKIAYDNLDEYEHIVRLEKENQELKLILTNLSGLLTGMKNDMAGIITEIEKIH